MSPRFFEPLFAHDLLTPPATALQNETTYFRHVAWPQRKTATGLDHAIGIFQPRVFRDAERREEMALGELVRPQPETLRITSPRTMEMPLL